MFCCVFMHVSVDMHDNLWCVIFDESVKDFPTQVLCSVYWSQKALRRERGQDIYFFNYGFLREDFINWIPLQCWQSIIPLLCLGGLALWSEVNPLYACVVHARISVVRYCHFIFIFLVRIFLCVGCIFLREQKPRLFDSDPSKNFWASVSIFVSE